MSSKASSVPFSPKSSAIRGIFNDFLGSAAKIYEQLCQQLEVVPSYLTTVINSKEAFDDVKHTAIVLATDVGPIVASQMAYNILEDGLTSEDGIVGFYSSLALWFAWTAKLAISLRQNIEAATRTTVMNITLTGAMEDATKDRWSFDDAHVCDDCTTARVAKGGLRNVLKYLAYMGIRAGLDKAVGGVVSLWGIDFIVDPFSAAIFGRLILDYPLASHLCDRHRQEYYIEHAEVVDGLGLPVVALAKVFCYITYQLTGVTGESYRGIVESVILTKMVGLAFHLKHLPPAVKSSSRSILPVGMIDRSITYVMDKVAKDVVELIKAAMDQEGESFDWQKFLARYLAFYDHPITKWLLCWVVPKMLLNGREAFVNDEVVRDHWPHIRDNLLFVLALYEKIAHETTAGAGRFIPKALIDKAAASKLRVSPQVVKDIRHVIRSIHTRRAAAILYEMIKDMPIRMGPQSAVEKVLHQMALQLPCTRAARRKALLDRTEPAALAPAPPTRYVAPTEPKPVVVAPYRSSHASIAPALIIEACRAGLSDYQKDFTTNKLNSSRGIWAKVYSQVSSGAEGNYRAMFYAELIHIAVQKDRVLRFPLNSLLACWLVLKNLKSISAPTTKNYIAVELNKTVISSLLGYNFSTIESGSSNERLIFQTVIDTLEKLCREGLKRPPEEELESIFTGILCNMTQYVRNPPNNFQIIKVDAKQYLEQICEVIKPPKATPSLLG